MATGDRELRAALFRFVDVVPACRSLDDLARHLTGFLDELPETTPPISAAMRMSGSRAGRTALGAAAAGGVRHLAHRFIVGESPGAALGTLRGLWDKGVASSVDLLGEATVTEGEADRYAAAAPRRSSSWPPRRAAGRAPGAGGRRGRPPASGQRVREGVRAHAAAAPRCPGARPGRRRRAPAPAAAPGPQPRRPPAHRHGVAGLPRGGARAGARAARRGGVPRRPVGRARAPSLPARFSRAA